MFGMDVLPLPTHSRVFVVVGLGALMSDEQKLTDRQSTVVHLFYRMSDRRDFKQGRAYTIKAETKRFV